MPTKVLTWNGIASSTIPELVIGKASRQLMGEVRKKNVYIPGRAGSVVFPEEPGDKLITFECYILGDTFQGRRDICSEVADWYEVLERSTLAPSDESGRFYYAEANSVVDLDEWRHLGEFELEWRISPYAYSETLSTETIDGSGAGSSSGSFSVPDSIDAEPVIEITPNDGTIETFSLSINSIPLSYTAPTIASGNTVTISSLTDTVYSGANTDTMLTGAYNVANVAMGFVSTNQFPILVPGSNSWALTWTGTATDVTIEVTWRERFR